MTAPITTFLNRDCRLSHLGADIFQAVAAVTLPTRHHAAPPPQAILRSGPARIHMYGNFTVEEASASGAKRLYIRRTEVYAENHRE
jgi:hypothetical protein